MVREAVYITSSVKCRPQHNRNPRPDELRICHQAWLEKQIQIVDPQLVVLLGRISSRQVLEQTGPLRDYHGKVVHLRGRAILPTYHPAAGMRFPYIERALKRDFKKIGTKRDLAKK